MLILLTNASRTMASSLVNPENLKESKKLTYSGAVDLWEYVACKGSTQNIM